MTGSSLKILLADDDTDDCLFFKEALDELKISATVTVVADGVELMQLLSSPDLSYPNALYLDLNMPRKNGFECLTEIRKSDKHRDLPIIMYTTSSRPGMIDEFFQSGATHYIRKPAEFQQLKEVLRKSIGLISDSGRGPGSKENFIVESQ